MKIKVSYRVKNWKSYNQALRDRGSLSVWFTDDAFTLLQRTGRGRPFKYSVNFVRMVLVRGMENTSLRERKTQNVEHERSELKDSFHFKTDLFNNAN